MARASGAFPDFPWSMPRIVYLLVVAVKQIDPGILLNRLEFRRVFAIAPAANLNRDERVPGSDLFFFAIASALVLRVPVYYRCRGNL
jgi:hypothetical protein